ncbi:MAG TPA: hypothetical protein VFS42_06125 [Burkholderiaceae bacterium]|nr:hypothetical protein [Burkholderiaceae bacterium]
MSWTDAIDLYCERTSSSMWAEPWNALSNLAFFVVAYLVWRQSRRHFGKNIPVDLSVLIVLIVCIGAGSTVFHFVGQRWAGVLDVLFIALYLHAYCAVFLARISHVPWRWAWLGAPAFWIFAQGIDALTGLARVDAVSRGTLGYAPALIALGAFACVARSSLLGLATGVFAVSLGLRALDLPLCAHWPWGTHFAWHVLNAVTLGLVTRALFLKSASSS